VSMTATTVLVEPVVMPHACGRLMAG